MEPNLFELVEKFNFFEKYLFPIKTKTNDVGVDDMTKIYGCRILGNYIAKKNGLNLNFFLEVIDYCINIITSIKNKNLAMKEILWVFENIILDDEKICEILCDNEIFMNEIIHYFRRINEIKDINEVSEFLQILVKKLDFNRYNKILREGILDISVEIVKKFWVDINTNFVGLFGFFEEIINLGDKYKENTEKRNLVLEKMEILGMQEIFENNIGNKSEKISKICENICDNYFNLIN